MLRVRDFVTNYIEREYSIDRGEDILSLNYVESGYIDSLGIIRFFFEMEDVFSIEFTERDLSDPSIRVVGKLISLIEQKLSIQRDGMTAMAG